MKIYSVSFLIYTFGHPLCSWPTAFGWIGVQEEIERNRRSGEWLASNAQVIAESHAEILNSNFAAPLLREYVCYSPPPYKTLTAFKCALSHKIRVSRLYLEKET